MRRAMIAGGALALASILWTMACALGPNAVPVDPNYPTAGPGYVSTCTSYRDASLTREHHD